MKKIILIVSVIVLCLIVGCGGSNSIKLTSYDLGKKANELGHTTFIQQYKGKMFEITEPKVTCTTTLAVNNEFAAILETTVKEIVNENLDASKKMNLSKSVVLFGDTSNNCGKFYVIDATKLSDKDKSKVGKVIETAAGDLYYHKPLRIEGELVTAGKMNGRINLTFANCKIVDDESTIDYKPLPNKSPAISNNKQSANPIYMGAINRTYESSADRENNYIHSAKLTIDGNVASCWSEGVPGLGIGENLLYQFNGTYKVSGFNIWVGHQKSTDLFYKNARPTRIRIEGSNGQSEIVRLNDVFGMQTVNLLSPMHTNSIKITIEAANDGSKWHDTSISEIAFF